MTPFSMEIEMLQERRAIVMSMSLNLESSIRLRPKDAKTCYVCGPENVSGLRVPFRADGAHGSWALYTARPEHEGWPGLLHGGVIFSLMDEALGWAVHFQGFYGVTAKIDTRFRRPISTGTRLMIKAWTVERRRNVITARAEVWAEGGNQPLLAEADAITYLQDSKKTVNGSPRTALTGSRPGRSDRIVVPLDGVR
jgi:acyl-coenzyme A thioesterase PaaI-like protein